MLDSFIQFVRDGGKKTEISMGLESKVQKLMCRFLPNLALVQSCFETKEQHPDAFFCIGVLAFFSLVVVFYVRTDMTKRKNCYYRPALSFFENSL